MKAVKDEDSENKIFRLRKAVSEDSRVIAPFQYYSQVGESIYCLDESSHEGSRRSYLHTDAEGRRLTQLHLGDECNEVELAKRLKGEDALEEDFATLMHEMHVAAQESPDLLFDAEEFDRLQAISRREPILIGGCGRSGTTLLLSVLGAHSDILAMPEEMYAFYPFPFRLSNLIADLQSKENDSWQHWCEKTPKNVRAFPEIHAAFDGKVRLIHIVRDGRDVVTSHHPNASEHYYISPERWVADVGAGWAQRELTLLIRYEDLVTSAQATLEVVCDFLSLPFDERMLTFETHSNVKENKAWDGKIAKAINSGQVARWQAPEHKARVDAFHASAGADDLMALLDYV